MKNVLLSADSDVSAYEVPDVVANNLAKYTAMFNRWLWNDPNAERFHIKTGDTSGVCYNETDFVEYLNVWIFPGEQSRLIETVGTFDDIASKQAIPERYIECEWYNF